MANYRNHDREIKRYSSSELEEGFLTHFQTFFNSTSNNFILMIWAHFRGSSFYLGNVFIPMMITFGVATFMPIVTGFTWILFISLTFTGLATYGTVFFTIRKSTIVKNINLTTTETAPLYFATFMLLGVSLFITINVIIGFAFILDRVGYLMEDFIIYEEGVVWNVSWIRVYTHPVLWYYWLEQMLLCFSLSFFAEKIVTTQKNFFMFVFTYLLAGIFFSGIMSAGLYVDADDKVEIITESTTMEELDGIMAVPTYMWGNSLWKIGQLFPHFGANQIVTPITSAASTSVDDLGNIVYNRWYNINILRSLGSVKAKYYAFMPWIWVIILLYVSAMLERYNKH